jgi:hypothetical protein
VNVSFGASRAFEMRSKQRLACGAGPVDVQKLALVDNSALVFGLRTNQRYTHSVQRDCRARGQRRPDECAFAGQRISVTLRAVATFVRGSDGRVFGQGASCKTAAELDQPKAEATRPAAQGSAGTAAADDGGAGCGVGGLGTEAVGAGQACVGQQCARMLAAFRDENKQDLQFIWEDTYGAGFDVTATEPEHEVARRASAVTATATATA